MVGAGPVGASLAHAARGMRVALVSHERPAAGGVRLGAFDARIYVLSPGNVRFLEALGVWQRLDRERLCPVHGMKIYGDEPDAKLQFDAYRAGVPELGWTVEDGALQDALTPGLEVEVGQCESLHVEPRGATLALADGRRFEADLVVGADGASSFVRAAAGIGARSSGYGQTAVVANFACERTHRNVALQWFQGGPVLALLPLPGEQVSMVWSLPEEEATRVAALNAAALCRRVEEASGGALGALGLTTAPKSFPLRRLAAERIVAHRVALAGDAAHVIHPLAGQGLNLGLQDVRALAAVLAEKEPVRDFGDLGLLRRYERRRSEPVFAMDATVDGLYRLFGASGGALSRLRNAGLNLAERLPVVKNMLVRHAID